MFWAESLAMQGSAAVLAVMGVFVVIPQATVLAGAAHQLRHATRKLKGHYTRRNCDDAVAENHQYASENTPHNGVWRNVPVANRGHRDDGPVHTHWDAGETVLLSFDLIHQGADNDHNGQHDKQKHNNFPGTGDDGGAQSRGLTNELREFQDPKDAQESQRTQNAEGPGRPEQKAEIDGSDREKIDNAEKTSAVIPRARGGSQTSNILDRKKTGDGPFGDAQRCAVILTNAGDALQKNREHTEKNQDE